MGLFDFFKKKETITDKVTEAGAAAADTVTTNVASAVDAAQNIPAVGAAVQGVSNAADTVIEKVEGVANTIPGDLDNKVVDQVKEFKEKIDGQN